MMPPLIVELLWICLAIISLSTTTFFVVATVGICLALYKQWKGYK